MKIGNRFIVKSLFLFLQFSTSLDDEGVDEGSPMSSKSLERCSSKRNIFKDKPSMSKSLDFDYFSMSSSKNNTETNKLHNVTTSPKLDTESHNDSDAEEFPIFYGRRTSSHGDIKKDSKNRSSADTDVVMILSSDDDL